VGTKSRHQSRITEREVGRDGRWARPSRVVSRPLFFFFFYLALSAAADDWQLTSLWAHPRVELNNMWGRIWTWERIFSGVAVVRRDSVRGSISIYDITFLLQSRTEDVRIHSFMCFLNIYYCCSQKERRELILCIIFDVCCSDCFSK